MRQEWQGLQSKLRPYIESFAFAAGLTNYQDPYQTMQFAQLLAAAKRELDQYVGRAQGSLTIAGRQVGAQGAQLARDLLQIEGLDARPVEIRQTAIAGWDRLFRRAERRALLGIMEAADTIRVNPAEPFSTQPGQALVDAVVNGIDSGLSELLTIAHDYQVHVVHEAMSQQYAQHDTLRYQRYSAFAPNTCMACILLHGFIYAQAEDFEDHPNGFCFILPIRPEWDGVIPEDAGEQWFLGLTPEQQREWMGPEYYAYWIAGRFQLKDLIKWLALGYAVVRALGELLEPDEEEPDSDQEN